MPNRCCDAASSDEDRAPRCVRFAIGNDNLFQGDKRNGRPDLYIRRGDLLLKRQWLLRAIAILPGIAVTRALR
jgi:hypothetical protein